MSEFKKEITGTFMERKALPDKRESVTQKFTIIDTDGSHSFYLTAGFYPEGNVGEIFVSTNKTGSSERSVIDAMARSVSFGLQYGIPLEQYVDLLIDMQGSPRGYVKGCEGIRTCHGPLDLIFRWLGIEFCDMRELAQTPVKKFIDEGEDK